MATAPGVHSLMTTTSYDPGFIALSYVVSLMGSITALEMLHRRTSRSGLLNWYLLLTSSITMGGIGIWCMHFIGNRAIILGNGEPRLQIAYDVAFTAVSFALPVIVLLVAFYAISFEEKATLPRLLIGGLLTGSAICGMHYVGQLGIANYICYYKVGNVIGAASIAAAAATLVLSVFFRWKAAWNDSWWRRYICGALLACAVTGMHYTAAVGTTYKPRTDNVGSNKELSRKTTVIVCSVLACISCVILIVSAAIAGRSRRRSMLRARQLVLSSAYFDPAGRIMVTPQALLPTRKIAQHYVGQTEDDEFSRFHPDFLWAFRASRNWACLQDMVPFMKTQLQADEPHSKRDVFGRPFLSDVERRDAAQATPQFKQMFCVSAQELADELHLPLSKLGILYNDVLTSRSQSSRLSSKKGLPRVEKGQLMFTVRHLSQEEAAQFAASGFGFAPIKAINKTLAQRTYIPADSLQAHIYEMRDYGSIKKGFAPGVHLVAFVLRPTMYSQFEVLTTKATDSALPACTLPIQTLSPSDIEIISALDEGTVPTCLEWLRSANTDSVPSRADEFRDCLFNALLELSSKLPEDMMAGARFCSHALSAPCRRPRLSPDPIKEQSQTCTLLSIRVIVPLGTRLGSPELRFTPLHLFRVEDHDNDGAADCERFAREFNDEFSYCVQTTASQLANTKMTINKVQQDHHGGTYKEKRHSYHFPFFSGIGGLPFLKYRSPPKARRLNSHESLIKMTPQTSRTTKSSDIGDIVISREVRVDIAQLGSSNRDTLQPQTRPSPPPPPPSSTTIGESSKIPPLPLPDHAVYGVYGRYKHDHRKSDVSFSPNYVDGLSSMCFSPGIRMRPSQLNVSYDFPPGSTIEE